MLSSAASSPYNSSAPGLWRGCGSRAPSAARSAGTEPELAQPGRAGTGAARGQCRLPAEPASAIHRYLPALSEPA